MQQRVLIVESRYYEDIIDELYLGIQNVLETNNVYIERLSVPGAFEIPAAISMVDKARRLGHLPYDHPFDGYIALGCVLRGETTHYETICQESARALQDIATNNQLAIANGILTCESKEQAWARASREDKNKGAEFANACLAMISLKRYLRFQDIQLDQEDKTIYNV